MARISLQCSRGRLTLVGQTKEAPRVTRQSVLLVAQPGSQQISEGPVVTTIRRKQTSHPGCRSLWNSSRIYPIKRRIRTRLCLLLGGQYKRSVFLPNMPIHLDKWHTIGGNNAFPWQNLAALSTERSPLISRARPLRP